MHDLCTSPYVSYTYTTGPKPSPALQHSHDSWVFYIIILAAAPT